MEIDAWHERWETGNIGFHQQEGHPALPRWFDSLDLVDQPRIFVPLCGKTGDIGWLLSQGCQVVGVELSEIAVVQLFSDLGVDPELETVGDITRYRGPNVEIFVGDIFALSIQDLGPVDAVYDRAALVALPEQMRARYAVHVQSLTDSAPQLMVVFVYDQATMSGPPFSIDESEMKRHFDKTYSLELLDQQDIPGGLKGKAEASERVWLLT